MKLYKCSKCGKIVELLNGETGEFSCCGEVMKEMIPGTSDGAMEKHVPAIKKCGKTVFVSVGEVMHPMDEDHYIEYIACEYKDSFVKIKFNPGDEPVTSFDYEPGMKIYAYCNKHGLWEKEV